MEEIPEHNMDDKQKEQKATDEVEILSGRVFERKVEDFTCENCGTFVQGDGYTDHCPSCLYSKHVDINPGDRASNCGGTMKPVAAEVKKNEYKIHYKCEKCGYEHKVRSSPNDSFDVILNLVKNPY